MGHILMSDAMVIRVIRSTRSIANVRVLVDTPVGGYLLSSALPPDLFGIGAFKLGYDTNVVPHFIRLIFASSVAT